MSTSTRPGCMPDDLAGMLEQRISTMSAWAPARWRSSRIRITTDDGEDAPGDPPVSQITPPVTGTFLGAHAIDPDDPHFVDRTINETLPAVAEVSGICCDAYCEEGACPSRTPHATSNRRSSGCPIRPRDQFNELGGRAGRRTRG